MSTITLTYFAPVEEFEAAFSGEPSSFETGEDGDLTIGYPNGAEIRADSAGDGLVDSYVFLGPNGDELLRFEGFAGISGEAFEYRVVYAGGDSEIVNFDFSAGVPFAPGVDQSDTEVVIADLGDGFDEITATSFGRGQISTESLGGGGVRITVAESGGETVTYEISGLERLEVDNGAFLFDVAGDEADNDLVYGLYAASLGRRPDEEGFRFWTDTAREGDFTPQELAAFFIDSGEFAAVAGEDLSDVEFVTALYDIVLGREPDQAGLDFWTGVFAEGSPRTEMVNFFVESDENEARIAEDIEAGYFVT